MSRIVNVLLAICFISSCMCARVPYMSQPQSMQDKFLNEHIFHDKRNGVFVDIGAHDGMSFSNTYFFEKELGWTGICFEPLQGPFEKLQKNRSCICINACAYTRDGKVKFIEVADHATEAQYPLFSQNMLSGMLHTYGKQHYERLMRELSEKGGFAKITTMNARKLAGVLEEYNIKKIDYLTIDIEGGEKKLLESIDYSQTKIHVITVENNYNDPSLRVFLESKGFQFITKLSVDEVYVNPYYPLDITAQESGGQQTEQPTVHTQN